jgi:hypothetical protein
MADSLQVICAKQVIHGMSDDDKKKILQYVTEELSIDEPIYPPDGLTSRQIILHKLYNYEIGNFFWHLMDNKKQRSFIPHHIVCSLIYTNDDGLKEFQMILSHNLVVQIFETKFVKETYDMILNTSILKKYYPSIELMYQRYLNIQLCITNEFNAHNRKQLDIKALKMLPNMEDAIQKTSLLFNNEPIITYDAINDKLLYIVEAYIGKDIIIDDDYGDIITN